MKEAFIYVIGVSVAPVKIGYATDFTSRLSALQIGCPDPLIVHSTHPVKGRLAARVENELHRRFADRHRRGEWFNVDSEEATSAAAEIIAAAEQRLQDAIERADIDADVYARAAHRTWLDPLAREAVAFYLSELRVKRDQRAVKTLNGYIRQTVGAPALVLFQRVFVEGITIEYEMVGRRNHIERGYTALATALNALAEYYGHRKRLLTKQLWSTSGEITRPDALREETRRRRMASQTAMVAKAKSA